MRFYQDLQYMLTFHGNTKIIALSMPTVSRLIVLRRLV